MWEKLGSESNKPPDNNPDVEQDNDELCVCALHFGKTYSTYAYSTRNDPNDIICPHWNSSRISTFLINHIVPTTMLLDEKQKLIAFGYEAEEQFSNLEAEEKKNFYFFQRFQMNLYDMFRSGENLSTHTKISDFNGKEVPAIDIFSTAIKYLIDHIQNYHKTHGASLEVRNIKWVLTVPAMSGDPEKKFMIQAAKKAGIDKTRLAIVLESEAAYIFCKELPVEKFEYGSNIGVFSPGQRYLVLNAEDETIDTTVFKVNPEGKVNVLRRASWENCGGAVVDNAFKQMLIDIVGEKFMDSFRQNNTADYIDIFSAFKRKKREKMGEYFIHRKINLVISPCFLEKYNEEMGTVVSKRTLETRYAKSLKWRGDKMRIDIDLFRSFFHPANVKLVICIREILSKPEAIGTKVILMVGGFSECQIVQDAIRKAFPECRVVVPHKAGLAVLKGAVLFGHSVISDDDNTTVLEEGDNGLVVALDNNKPNNTTEDRRSDAALDRLFGICTTL